MMRRTNTNPVVRAALWLLTASISLTSHGQGLNNLWMGGYDGSFGPPFGGIDLSFDGGELSITQVSRAIGFKRTCANITDDSGNLSFSTNGSFVANATGDTMANGSGLSPSTYTSTYPGGLFISQAALILPYPEHDGQFFLFHSTIDNDQTLTASYVYLSLIDMSLDGGFGGVVFKNQPVVTDDLNAGKITAVKHANGRDWWVFCHKANSTTYYRLLVDPQGVSEPLTQDIGTIRPPDLGQVCFSPDGSRFAYYYGDADLDILRFDRCSGLFSDPVHVDIDDFDQMGGVAFSPNGRFLYVSSVNDVYQFDMTAADITSSQLHIAEWDGFYSPAPPLATTFDLAQLAPDGKLYISTGNSTFHLHVIVSPDSLGVACGMVQHGIELPAYFANSLPNHPNYHLGPLAGSPCDTLGLGVVEHTPPLLLSAYPNPSAGAFTLSYTAQSEVGTIDIRDPSGKLLLQERVPPWSTVHHFTLPDAGAGLYQCTLRWGKRATAVRVVVER